jgi:S-formylglutathione hydrolase FrmB
MTWWVRTARISILAAMGCIFVFGVLLQPFMAQFNTERSRTDLSPLKLPGGSTVEFKSFNAKSLGMPEHYSAFLPPSFSQGSSRTYPVIYFLHGLNNNETSWTLERYGSIQEKLEEMMLSGKVSEFIMIHPRGDNSFYCD